MKISWRKRGHSKHPPHIGLNAHLLSMGENYRSAGISNYIYQLIRHLPIVSDFQYTVWTSERAGDLNGVTRRVTPLPTGRPAVRVAWEQLLQPYAVARTGIDLLHGLAFVLPLWLARPAVVTIYDLTFLHMPEAFRPANRLYLRFMTRLSARRATLVCAIAKHGKQDIVNHLGVSPHKIEVVYPGLDSRFAALPTREEVSAFRATKGLPERFILYLGTLEPRKNVPTLLRAFAQLARRVPYVDLVIAGGKGWGFKEIFAETERLGLQRRVHFPGFVPSDEQALWYAAADLFVYPSRYEGFGLPPLEAMACGTPVVTSNASSLTEVVGAAGTTVAPDDEDSLAEAMAALIASPSTRDHYTEQGLKQVRRFQWEESAAVQASVYRRALEGTA